MNWEYAFQLYVTLIVSLTFHEAAHAWLAMLGGDRTAFYAGQVTLNPIAHMRREPFGTIVLPLLMLGSQIYLQKMTPSTGGDPAQQRMMMFMMPVMMAWVLFKLYLK
jgi:membrane protein insertase Oxa1/YidC/SpoIIIJ